MIFVIITPIVITSIKAATYTVQSSLVLNIRQIYQDMDGVIECTSCLSRRIVFIHHVILIEFCMRYMIIFLERASFHWCDWVENGRCAFWRSWRNTAHLPRVWHCLRFPQVHRLPVSGGNWGGKDPQMLQSLLQQISWHIWCESFQFINLYNGK